MGAFDAELSRLGYRFYTQGETECNQKLTADQIRARERLRDKERIQKLVSQHVASMPCLGSCGQRCPNHYCWAHNGEPFRPRNMSWAEYLPRWEAHRQKAAPKPGDSDGHR